MSRQPTRQRSRQVPLRLQWPGSLREAASQTVRLAFDEFENEKGIALCLFKTVNRRNIWMIKRGK